MHRLKLGVAVAVLLAMSRLASAQADISGTWVVSLETPQGKMELETTVKQDGDKVSGQLASPMGTVDFSGTYAKNELSILYSVPIQGQVIDIRMTGNAQGDTLSGMVDLGGLLQAPWSAKRKPVGGASTATAAAASTPATNGGAPGSVTGKWNVTVQMGPNPLALSATLTQSGEAVTGSIHTPFGDLPATGTMAGGALTLQFTAPLPQGPMEVTMSGQLGPSGLSGKAAMGGMGESDWSAVRAAD